MSIKKTRKIIENTPRSPRFPLHIICVTYKMHSSSIRTDNAANGKKEKHTHMHSNAQTALTM